MKLSSILIPVFFLTFLSCNNDEDLECCNSITEGNYTESLIIINDFLNDLNYEDAGNLGENSGLEQLEDWLEQKPCITDVEITCFWCLFTNPPGGELSIFLNNSSDTLKLALVGSIPHKAVGLY
jgi:hypothetical protein